MSSPKNTTPDERLCEIALRKFAKQADREYAKLWEMSSDSVFSLGSPAFLSETSNRAAKILSDLATNLQRHFQEIWSEPGGGITAGCIRAKLLPRASAKITDLATRMKERLSGLPFHPDDLQMALNFLDVKAADLIDELTGECGAAASRLEKQETQKSATPQEFRSSDEIRSRRHKPTTSISIPALWSEWVNKGSFSQTETAELIGCSRRTIYNFVQRHELKQSRKKRIVCDELLRQRIRDRHGDRFLR